MLHFVFHLLQYIELAFLSEELSSLDIENFLPLVVKVAFEHFKRKFSGVSLPHLLTQCYFLLNLIRLKFNQVKAVYQGSTFADQLHFTETFSQPSHSLLDSELLISRNCLLVNCLSAAISVDVKW